MSSVAGDEAAERSELSSAIWALLMYEGDCGEDVSDIEAASRAVTNSPPVIVRLCKLMVLALAWPFALSNRRVQLPAEQSVAEKSSGAVAATVHVPPPQLTSVSLISHRAELCELSRLTDSLSPFELMELQIGDAAAHNAQAAAKAALLHVHARRWTRGGRRIEPQIAAQAQVEPVMEKFSEPALSR